MNRPRGRGRGRGRGTVQATDAIVPAPEPEEVARTDSPMPGPSHQKRRKPPPRKKRRINLRFQSSSSSSSSDENDPDDIDKIIINDPARYGGLSREEVEKILQEHTKEVSESTEGRKRKRAYPAPTAAKPSTVRVSNQPYNPKSAIGYAMYCVVITEWWKDTGIPSHNSQFEDNSVSNLPSLILAYYLQMRYKDYDTTSGQKLKPFKLKKKKAEFAEYMENTPEAEQKRRKFPVSLHVDSPVEHILQYTAKRLYEKMQEYNTDKAVWDNLPDEEQDGVESPLQKLRKQELMQSKLQMENNLMVYGSKIKDPFRDDLALAIGPIIKTPLFLNEQVVPELIQAVLGDGCGQRFLKTIRRLYREAINKDENDFQSGTWMFDLAFWNPYLRSACSTEFSRDEVSNQVIGHRPWDINTARNADIGDIENGSFQKTNAIHSIILNGNSSASFQFCGTMFLHLWSLRDMADMNEFRLTEEQTSQTLVYLNNYILEMIERASTRGIGLAFCKNMSEIANKYMWRGASFARRENLYTLVNKFAQPFALLASVDYDHSDFEPHQMDLEFFNLLKENFPSIFSTQEEVEEDRPVRRRADDITDEEEEEVPTTSTANDTLLSPVVERNTTSSSLSRINTKRGAAVHTPPMANSTLLDQIIVSETEREQHSMDIDTTSMELTHLQLQVQAQAQVHTVPPITPEESIDETDIAPDRQLTDEQRAKNLITFLKQMCSEEANTNFSSREWCICTMICGGNDAHSNYRKNRRGVMTKKLGPQVPIHHANCNVCKRKSYSPCDPTLQRFVNKFATKQQKQQGGRLVLLTDDRYRYRCHNCEQANSTTRTDNRNRKAAVVKYLADKFNITTTCESMVDLIGCDFNVADLDPEFRQQFEQSWFGNPNESMMDKLFALPTNYREIDSDTEQDSPDYPWKIGQKVDVNFQY
ncbi:uncharacterized protein LOC129570908 [Sitodiplosis mosellana]|uniref:uncharacterized protein LOC129570908 n=1 Tax=Sitodiplosis mosellana TaxID=263140 RepID=UPI002444132E|nr:uncharacterized protein LOC129570908 [Sitodiplosis mosellana]